ncbi:hypothetical protein [methane-oxidizing endosymbiont of Gigantopelta aegis]|uniref:hypothetical protein n=1 Tax=methane-oxidizing endosymbiont of Gigantopelta aegis TaxID=2794938 RepID=UPI0018DD52F6|nr:hypothetical protein [methane-oxidizing endosymbiont of Gigantopelta aegis]
MSNGENENLNESESTSASETSQDNTQQTEATTETTAKASNPAADTASNIVAKIMALKESNPKVFFGGIGAVVLLIVIIMFSSGSNKQLPTFKQTPIVLGNEYKLKGPNATAPEATIRLVAVPGSIAAFDDSEEDDRVGGCKHMPQGTRVKALQTQAAYGKKDAFVQVEILDGECKGKTGWTLGINLK